MIPDSFVQDLLARVSVEDVVGRYVQLRKGGANLLGLCPFHTEKSPSFTVSPAKQFYHCFGCGAHGSAITFLMEHTGASFPEAVRSLAAEAGMTVPEAERSPRQREASKRRRAEQSRHQQVLEAAQDHYLKQLKASPAAIAYLKQRGLSGEIAAKFGLGWSGGGRRALAGVMPEYEDPVLVEAGLVIEADDGRRYDRFRDRIMFPIRDRGGRLIGFGGRLIEKGEPKYLNSPETSLFSKGRELYGLWEGRAGIRQEGSVLVVEGYMDVVALAQHGLGNAVATLGTATTETHIEKLMRNSDRIVFSFDGDKAGRSAAWRALNTCLPMLRDDVAIRFLFLPYKHDPDSYIRDYGVKAFRASLAQAEPLSAFLLSELGSRHAMDEPEGRAACIHEAAPLLSQLPDTALKVQIEREFAQQVRLTPEELESMLARVSRPRFGPQATAGGTEVAASRPGSRSSSPLRAGGIVANRPQSGWDAPEAFESDAEASDADAVAAYFQDAPSAHGERQGETAPTRVARKRNGGVQKRAVTPMAKRLMRLLLAHPGLVQRVGDQQLEILEHSPHLLLVRDLITLANASGAQHAGALLQAADPESDLGHVLASLSTDLLSAEDLPDPYAEWTDALKRIELDAIKAEQSALVRAGLRDEASQKRYQELTRQLALINRANSC